MRGRQQCCSNHKMPPKDRTERNVMQKNYTRQMVGTGESQQQAFVRRRSVMFWPCLRMYLNRRKSVYLGKPQSAGVPRDVPTMLFELLGTQMPNWHWRAQISSVQVPGKSQVQRAGSQVHSTQVLVLCLKSVFQIPHLGLRQQFISSLQMPENTVIASSLVPSAVKRRPDQPLNIPL